MTEPKGQFPYHLIVVYANVGICLAMICCIVSIFPACLRTTLRPKAFSGAYVVTNVASVDALLVEHQVQLIQSAIRGRSPDPEKPHLSDFDIQFGEGGKPSQVTCPGGQKVAVHTTHPLCEKGCVACFEMSVCQACPFLKEGKCLAQAGKRDTRLRMRFTQVEGQSSQRRRLGKENKPRADNLRAAVEATVRIVKLPFAEAQLPVRGKFRVACMLIGSAAVANVRRIQRCLQARLKAEIKQKTAQSQQGGAQNELAAHSFFGSVRGFFARLLSPSLAFMPTLPGF